MRKNYIPRRIIPAPCPWVKVTRGFGADCLVLSLPEQMAIPVVPVRLSFLTAPRGGPIVNSGPSLLTPDTPMADRTYRWLLVSLAVIGLTADQASKYGVFSWLYKGGEFTDSSRTGNESVVVPNWFKLIAQFDPDAARSATADFPTCKRWSAPVMPRVNHGALFGIGGSRKGLANGLFAAVSVAAAIAIVVWGTRRTTAREKGLMAALGLILGGTVGNLYDRLVFGGVRDFMHFCVVRDDGSIAFDWPVFNIADCCLVVGAALLLVQAVFVTPAATSNRPCRTTNRSSPRARRREARCLQPRSGDRF